jgi:hypothetical protein
LSEGDEQWIGEENMSDLRKEIETVINCASAENGSNTPDFILASYLGDCLAAFDRAVNAREAWYGRVPSPPGSAEASHE